MTASGSSRAIWRTARPSAGPVPRAVGSATTETEPAAIPHRAPAQPSTWLAAVTTWTASAMGAQIGIGHDLRDLADLQRIEKADRIGQREFCRELEQVVFHVAIAVNVKLGIGQLGPDLAKGADGDVEALVPLEAAGEKNDNFVVVTGAGAGAENSGIYVVDENRTLAV